MELLLTKELLLQAKQWLDEQKANMPPDVVFCLTILLENILKGEGNSKQAAKGFHELLVKLGFKPSSEKRKGIATKDPATAEKLAQVAKECCKKLLEHGELKEQLSEEMAEKLTIKCPERSDVDVAKVESIFAIRDEQQRQDAIDADMNSRLALGGGGDPALEKRGEALFPKADAAAQERAVHFTLDNKDLTSAFGKNPKGLVRESVTTKRFDFVVQTISHRVSYETARDPRSGRSISAAPESFGPKGAQITYRAIVNLVLLAVGFLMPTHRISRLLGSLPIFDRSNILRYLGFAARRLVPVYMELGKQLSNASYLWADATPTRVNEVNGAFEKRQQWEKQNLAGPPEPYPWEVTQDPHTEISSEEEFVPEETESENSVTEFLQKPLWRILQKEYGFAFQKKKANSSKSKTRHQTMVIHGRAQQDQADSYIFFFRSCLGDVGNVLDTLLQSRSSKTVDLYLQCDHSSANVPSDPAVLKRYKIHLAGCFAHARRMFKKHESQDPETAGGILTAMFQIPYIEHRLKEAGRNRENTLSMRRSWGAHAMEILYFAVQRALQSPNWSDQTPLGKAGRHFIKHFKKLTVYLEHPELEATNNSSERALRPEKLAQGSSYFRDSLEGRARFDILRTIYQTCSSIELSFSEYLLHIFLQPKLEIIKNPQNYTPQAVKKELTKAPHTKTKLERILLRGY